MLGIEYMSVMVICPTGRANDGSILALNIQYKCTIKTHKIF